MAVRNGQFLVFETEYLPPNTYALHSKHAIKLKTAVMRYNWWCIFIQNIMNKSTLS
jgi:hypothetical protein